MFQRRLVLETSYHLDGTAGLTTLVMGFDINSIINHKVRHFKRFSAAPLTKVTVPKLGNAYIKS